MLGPVDTWVLDIAELGECGHDAAFRRKNQPRSLGIKPPATGSINHPLWDYEAIALGWWWPFYLLR